MPHTPVDGDTASSSQKAKTHNDARRNLVVAPRQSSSAGCASDFAGRVRLGNYIADFVAHSCKLVVEIDGESHDFEERLRYDEKRDQWLASRGYRVLRFTNDDVMKNLEGVVLAISQAAQQAAPPSLTLPRKGGGNRARRMSNDAKGKL